MSDYTESRNEEMIRAIIDDTSYHTDYTQGRNEQILQSIIDNTPYTKEPESRMEALLIELKAKIEGGGGDYQAKSVMPDFSDGDVVVTPDSGYDALSSVTVEKDTDLIASNIKKDVEIFGVTGSYEMPADIETDMNAVLNKKMGTTTTYAPDTWADTVNLMGKLPEKTATGAIASFNDGADDVPIVSGVFDIVAQQSGSGDPSPSNPRPITGFTGMTIHRADGENPHVIDTEYEVDWTTEAGTVYGGSLNLTTGVLTVTHKSIVLDGSEYWGNLTQNHFALLTLEDNYTRKISTNLCDKFKIQSMVGWTNIENLCVGFLISSSSSLNVIALRNDDWETTQDLKDWLSSNNTRLVYELATPQTYQLSPVEIKTLLGSNNIWTDTGDSTITYRADIDLALQNL